MLRVRIILVAVIATVSCADQRSADEAAVIGMWREETVDTVIRYSFMADHRLDVCVDDGLCDADAIIHGTWQIRGEHVVYELDWAPHSIGAEPPPKKDYTKPLAIFKDRSSPNVAPYFRRDDKRI